MTTNNLWGKYVGQDGIDKIPDNTAKFEKMVERVLGTGLTR